MFAAPDLESGQMVHVLPEIYVEETFSLVDLSDPTPLTQAYVDFMANWSRTLTSADGLGYPPAP